MQIFLLHNFEEAKICAQAKFIIKVQLRRGS